jgi:Carbohydrate family 9 binding domain-like
MKSGSATPPPTAEAGFSRWIAVSFFMHALLFSACFLAVNINALLRHEPSTASTATIDSVRQTMTPQKLLDAARKFKDSLAAPLPAAGAARAVTYYPPDSLPWNAMEPDTLEWLRRLIDNPVDPTAFTSAFPSSGESDTALAALELLRQSLVASAMQALSRAGALGAGADVDWSALASALTAMILDKVKHGGLDPSSQEAVQRLIAVMRMENQLKPIMDQLFLFSLRNEALRRLKEAIRKAISESLAQEAGCLHGSNGTTRGRRGKGGAIDIGEYGIEGEFGSFIGFGKGSRRRFELQLERMLAAMGAGGLGNLTSLFPAEELVRILSQYARETMLRAMGNGPDAQRWSSETDFNGILRKSLFPGTRSARSRAMAQADQLLETIRKTLAGSLADRFASWPNIYDLKHNPGYFNSLAKSYWNLVFQCMRSPNLVVPNIDKYTEAALKARSRSLPQSTELLVGGETILQPRQLDYFRPRFVYIERGAAPPAPAAFAPLVPAGFASTAWGGAMRRTRPVVIDGDLSEWDACLPYALWGQPQGARPLPEPMKGQNFLLTQWDNTGFYFALRIYDQRDNPLKFPEFWDADALELFFDPQNAKDSVRVEGRSSQFWIWPRSPNARGNTGQSIFTSPHNFEPRILKDGLIRYASKRSGDSYSVEAFVPAAIVPTLSPLPGKIIGFNYSIDNGELLYIRWVTNRGELESERPNLWGDLLLMGSDATVTLAPADAALPGQNIDITINDADMDLDATRPDHVWATIRSALTGDAFPLSLLETGASTGIFHAQAGTVFAVKPKAADRLSVRPGDIVTVSYVDQHASGGRKNVTIERQVRIARAVYSFAK